MDNTWIKVYRKILENPIATDLELLGFMTWCFIKANHKDNDAYINKTKVLVKRGSFITSTEKIASHFGISRSKAYRLISITEAEHILKHDSNTKYTVITLLNYDRYQPIETQTETQKNIKKTTERQQKDTNKNVKNEENEKNNTNVLQKVSFGDPSINEALSYMKEKLGLPLLDDSEQVNRNYANLLLKKFGGIEKVKLLIDATATHDFWSTRMTSMKSLYYKGVNIISSGRDIKNSVTKL